VDQQDDPGQDSPANCCGCLDDCGLQRSIRQAQRQVLALNPYLVPGEPFFAEAAVLDREHVFIGSFNFNPRSRELNTEMGILVHSPEFGEQVATVMERAMTADNAWRLRMDERGDLSWESAAGTLTSQPSGSFWRRVQNGIFGLFPVERHL
jgi:phosphatidylserine/phosphatidylglycerophosphate/cardiolipin synthase-like enzyme